jgi:primosomal protein N' (replication factor Y)
MGSYVRFRFHAKLTRGWVLGPTDDVPRRTLPIMRAVSPVRYFDEPMLALARWTAERYVAPLATVLGSLAPPRVADEEEAPALAIEPRQRMGEERFPSSHVLESYRGGDDLIAAIQRGRSTENAWTLRPAPEDEAVVAVELVGAALRAGRRALVLVPEAHPLPATATALLEAFGARLGLFLGGSKRERYRRWLEIQAGGFDVIVGTRSAVFAPIAGLGLVVVSRESHPAFREERAPYHHARDVALARARLTDGWHGSSVVCVLSALCSSSEAAALGLPQVAPTRRRWPKVEVVRPGPEGRASRVVEALRVARRAFVYAPVPGYGIAQVCRSCGAPAACAACGGMLRSEAGAIRCIVCEASGRCAVCGSTSFGVRRGGAERVEEWVSRYATVPVVRPDRPRLPDAAGEVLIGGPSSVRDLGVGALDLVAILDADLAERRPGLGARMSALAIWMEAVGWARPDGRAIVQSSHPSDPAVQALVRGNPDRFHARERERRATAGFPVGAPVFRVVGTAEVEAAIEEHRPITALTTSLGDRTVCLLALEADRVRAFGAAMRRLAATGVVERVEAEPHI